MIRRTIMPRLGSLGFLTISKFSKFHLTVLILCSIMAGRLNSMLSRQIPIGEYNPVSTSFPKLTLNQTPYGALHQPSWLLASAHHFHQLLPRHRHFDESKRPRSASNVTTATATLFAKLRPDGKPISAVKLPYKQKGNRPWATPSAASRPPSSDPSTTPFLKIPRAQPPPRKSPSKVSPPTQPPHHHHPLTPPKKTISTTA